MWNGREKEREEERGGETEEGMIGEGGGEGGEGGEGGGVRDTGRETEGRERQRKRERDGGEEEIQKE